ncbi:Phospholipid-transporting ATPase IK [Schistosoma japonicum]|uniref:Phospholipid-transporting ATPase IK n=1 Tax=Schistosoma japonicum TaxID=6182 RepID=A0A4Z2CXK3_SCHJA|nr:Phospholipid-transporting ATPase IK [Schistosoma japonicum]
MPLFIILLITMIKDGIEDILRHKSDKQINSIEYQVLNIDFHCKHINWILKKASMLSVGDVIRCNVNQSFPCDLLLLSSSNSIGQVCITTANLDGEYEKFYPLTVKNLALRGTKLILTDYIIGLVVYTGKETKLSLNSQHTQRKYSTRENLSNLILLIFMLCMMLTTILLTILSTIWIRNNAMNLWYITFEALTIWQFIRITIEFQQLLLVYMIKNDNKMYSTMNNLQNYANNSQLIDELGQIEFLFSDKTGTLTQNHMILRLCCLLDDNHDNEQVYKCDIEQPQPPPQQHRHDEDDDVDIENVNMNKSVIHDANVVDASSSSLSSDEDDNDADKDVSRDLNENFTTLHNHQSLLLSKVNYNVKYPKQPDMNQNLLDFLTIAALCHTVDLKYDNHSIENNHSDNNNMNKHDTLFTSKEPSRYYEYEATSADEKALVEGASLLGVVYSGKQLDVDEEFDSLRKCMSVMVRYPDETYYVLSKGAEISILDPKRCSRTSNHRRTQAMNYVNEYAINGLRTLVFAKRQLHKNVYMNLLNNLKIASGLIGKARNVALKKCYQQIECDMKPICVTGIEDKLQPGVKKCIKDLKEAGIQIWILTGDKAETAITVSQSVGHLTPNMSLIRIMNCQTLELTAYKIYEQLTGLHLCQEQQEQQQTTIKKSESMISMMNTKIRKQNNNDIQNNSTVLHNQFTLPRIKTIDYDQNNENYKASNDRNDEIYYYNGNKFIWNHRNCLPVVNCKRYIRRKHRKYPGMANESIGLIIDGQSLQYALHPSLRNAFLELCMNVTTVLCCRMTPLQKASIVKLVQIGLAKFTRQGMKPVIAAIGDGGNDVAMILQANIGIGVCGKEGREAVCASDYAVTQFKHIKRLFLLHGHWAYYRITITMLFFYHKSVAFVSNQVCLTWFTGFSEIPSFGNILFICYNLTMTFLVSLGYGMFERHIQEKMLLNKPHLYKAWIQIVHHNLTQATLVNNVISK